MKQREKLAAVDCGSSKFTELVTSLKGFGVLIEAIELSAANAHDFSQSDAVIISGGPHLFTGPESDWLKNMFQFLERLSIPVLGICLGHQAIALTAGGDVYRGPERRKQDKILQICSDHPLFRGIPDGAEFAEDHCEGIVSPPDFEVLARSDYYAIEAIGSDRDRRYGVQFHPEVSREDGLQLLANFVAMISLDQT